MPKPGKEELDSAIHMATQMREKDMDTFFLAKSLLNHNYRISYLEQIITIADRYLNMGMAENERTALLKAIEKSQRFRISYCKAREGKSWARIIR